MGIAFAVPSCLQIAHRSFSVQFTGLSAFIELEKCTLHRISRSANNPLPLLVETGFGARGYINDAGLSCDRGSGTKLQHHVQELMQLRLTV
jgi:hypothetical protein